MICRAREPTWQPPSCCPKPGSPNSGIKATSSQPWQVCTSLAGPHILQHNSGPEAGNVHDLSHVREQQQQQQQQPLCRCLLSVRISSTKCQSLTKFGRAIGHAQVPLHSLRAVQYSVLRGLLCGRLRGPGACGDDQAPPPLPAAELQGAAGLQTLRFVLHHALF